MYAFVQKSGHIVWKGCWYAFMLGVSLQVGFYMTWKDQVFIVDVVVIDLMQETMALSVINWPTSAVAKFNAIVKIHKYKTFYEWHHFILMAMKVHDTLVRDMDHFVKECAQFFHDRWLGVHLSLSFCIQFFKQRVSISPSVL
jgi:hypothetical protein